MHTSRIRALEQLHGPLSRFDAGAKSIATFSLCEPFPPYIHIMANQPNFDLATSIFPPPPAYYKAFTDVNVARYAELRAQAGEASGTSKNRAAGPSSHERPSDEVDGDEQMTQDLSESEKEELRELQGLLEKPRADWVREGGAWMSFGQRYDVGPFVPLLSIPFPDIRSIEGGS